MVKRCSTDPLVAGAIVRSKRRLSQKSSLLPPRFESMTRSLSLPGAAAWPLQAKLSTTDCACGLMKFAWSDRSWQLLSSVCKSDIHCDDDRLERRSKIGRAA